MAILNKAPIINSSSSSSSSCFSSVVGVAGTSIKSRKIIFHNKNNQQRYTKGMKMMSNTRIINNLSHNSFSSSSSNNNNNNNYCRPLRTRSSSTILNQDDHQQKFDKEDEEIITNGCSSTSGNTTAYYSVYSHKTDTLQELERLYRLPSYHDDYDDDDDGDSISGGSGGGNNRPVRVVYQGVRGSYCQEAAMKAFSNMSNVDFSSCSTRMEDAFQALENRSADRAIIPIENSIDGTIDRNLDLLLRHGQNVQILRELILPVNHCLLTTTPPATAAVNQNQLVMIKRIVSHPQALSHCKLKLSEYNSYLLDDDLEVVEVPNAADAAKFMSENGISDTAVIGSRIAAKEFGLQILEENIQDSSSSGNFNRFLELGLTNNNNHHHYYQFGGGDRRWRRRRMLHKKKTTVAFTLEKGVSDMYRALEIFERENIRVTRVEHRPNRSNPMKISGTHYHQQHQQQLLLLQPPPRCYFDYVFILDLVIEDDGNWSCLKAALSRLDGISGDSVRVLGSGYTYGLIS